MRRLRQALSRGRNPIGRAEPDAKRSVYPLYALYFYLSTACTGDLCSNILNHRDNAEAGSVKAKKARILSIAGGNGKNSEVRSSFLRSGFAVVLLSVGYAAMR